MKNYVLSIFRKTQKIEIFILIQIVLLLLVTFSVLAIFSNSRVQHREENFVKNSIESYNSSVEKIIKERLSSAHKTIQLISNVINENPIEFLDTQSSNYLTLLMASSPEIWSLYIGYPNRAFFQISKTTPEDTLVLARNVPIPKGTNYRYHIISSQDLSENWLYTNKMGVILEKESLPKAAYNPMTRPWFTEAFKRQRSIFTDAYIFGNTAGPVFTISAPGLPKNIRKSPIVAIDISLNNLSQILHEGRLSPHSYIYILNKDSRIIALSDSHTMDEKNKNDLIDVKELRTNYLKKSLDYFKEYKENTFRINLEGTNYIVSISRVFLTDSAYWDVVSIVDYHEYMYSLVETENNNYSIFIFILFISILQIILLARRIANPIQDLTIQAEKIGAFDLEKDEEIRSSINEIDTLAKTINSMRYSLSIFAKYIPVQLVKRLVGNNKKISIGGETKSLTLLFTDIKGFSSISEKIRPEELMLQLSSYFEVLSRIIMDHDGVVDKYIGDAVMAFWGAPDEDPSHSKNACRALLKILSALEALNQEFEKNGKPIFQTRFGLHYGEVIVGNIGSADRMNYTVIGDNVNLAARLEGANKYTGTSVLVSNSIYELAKPDFIFRKVDVLVVKGKTKGEHVFELMGSKTGDSKFIPSEEIKNYVTDFNRAFEFYINMNFPQAIKILLGLKNLDKKQKLIVSNFIERCENFIKIPPPDDWRGEFILEKK